MRTATPEDTTAVTAAEAAAEPVQVLVPKEVTEVQVKAPEAGVMPVTALQPQAAEEKAEMEDLPQVPVPSSSMVM